MSSTWAFFFFFAKKVTKPHFQSYFYKVKHCPILENYFACNKPATKYTSKQRYVQVDCNSSFCRLRDPRKCPTNGSHFDACDCEDEDHKMSGGSYFSKLRVDLSAMRIIGK